MGRRLKVTRLPAAVREEIDRLIRDGRTLDEIVAHLRALPLQPEELPGRTSVHRYRKQFEKTVAHVRDTQAIAGQLLTQFGEDPNGLRGKALLEMLKAIAFQVLSTRIGEDGEATPVKATDFAALAKGLRDITLSAKTHEEIDRAIRQELAAKVDEATADGATAKDPLALVNEVRAIYGLAPVGGEGAA